jgi:hypothetical protein
MYDMCEKKKKSQSRNKTRKHGTTLFSIVVKNKPEQSDERHSLIAAVDTYT